MIIDQSLLFTIVGSGFAAGVCAGGAFAAVLTIWLARR